MTSMNEFPDRCREAFFLNDMIRMTCNDAIGEVRPRAWVQTYKGANINVDGSQVTLVGSDEVSFIVDMIYLTEYWAEYVRSRQILLAAIQGATTADDLLRAQGVSVNE